MTAMNRLKMMIRKWLYGTDQVPLITHEDVRKVIFYGHTHQPLMTTEDAIKFIEQYPRAIIY